MRVYGKTKPDETLLTFSVFLFLSVAGRANVVTLEIYSFNQPMQNVTVSACDTLVISNLSSTMSYSLCQEADGSADWPPGPIIANMANGTVTYFYLDDLTPYTHLSVMHQISNLVFFITITPVQESIIHATICEGASYTFNGQDYTTPGTYSQLFASDTSCDSLLTLNLQVVPSFHSTTFGTICPGELFLFEDSMYTVPGTYEHIYQTVDGCDSIHTLVLDQFPAIDVSVTQLDANTLQAASLTTTNFQWVDCDDDYAWIGASGASFTPQQNGLYAAVALENGCLDTSECMPISAIGLEENTDANFSVFPVPTADLLTLQTDMLAGSTFTIVSPAGAIVLTGRIEASATTVDIGGLASGIYYLQITDSEIVRKIVRE